MTVPITLNGDPAEVDAGTTVASLLDRLGIQRRRVLVEHNRRVLRADDDGDAAVLDGGDEVEILHQVGGG